MRRPVFLDLYDVLVDSARMGERYADRMAAILHRDYGGDPARWRRIHDDAFAWYLERGAELDALPDDRREGDAWVRAVERLEMDYIVHVFDAAGLPPPDDRAAMSERLESEIVRGIDASYPDVPITLRALRARGHELHLSTNARRANAESALVGAGIRDLFSALGMMETGQAKKDRPHYWRRAFALAGCDPRDAVVVDDVARYLVPPAAMGATCVQLLRPARDPHAGPFPVPEKDLEPGPFPILESLADLPGFLDAQGRTQSKRK